MLFKTKIMKLKSKYIINSKNCYFTHYRDMCMYVRTHTHTHERIKLDWASTRITNSHL